MFRLNLLYQNKHFYFFYFKKYLLNYDKPLYFVSLKLSVMLKRYLPFFLFGLAIIFFISSLAETNRTPFDLPEAEAELVAGFNVEYSSITFALFFLGEYSNMLLMSTINVLLFWGG